MSFLVIAIDPGVLRTGVIVMTESKEILGEATFESKKSEFAHGARVSDMAREIRQWLDEVVPPSRWDNHVRFVIETPIMNKVRNVKTFSLQWRLVQELLPTSNDPDLTIIEVHNTSVKKAATGNAKASKADMVEASPYSYGEFGDTVRGNESVEALADAYGVALCAFESSRKHISYQNTGRDLACTKGPVHEL